MEDSRNLISVCKDCSDKRKQQVQENFKQKFQMYISMLHGNNPDNPIYVKVRFEDTVSHKGEFMWVNCTTVDFDAETIVGTLDNDPVYVKQLNCGDIIHLKFSDVEDIFNYDKLMGGLSNDYIQ